MPRAEGPARRSVLAPWMALALPAMLARAAMLALPAMLERAAMLARAATLALAALFPLAATLSLPAAAAPAPMELRELMALLAQRRSGEARFVEQRWVAGLERTLQYSGTLSFTAPDVLVRRTLAPRPESFEARGNTVTVERGGRTRTLALDTQPELAAMVAAMRGTLTGDASALQRHFEPAVDGTSQRWTLKLVPREYALRAVVREVRIDGRQAELSTVELQLADGDRSLMTVEPVAPPQPRASAP